MLATGEIEAVGITLNIEGRPPLVLPEIALLWAVDEKSGTPSWTKVANLRPTHFVSSPCDMGGDVNGDGTLQEAVTAYVAGSLLADGMGQARNPCPLPRSLGIPGMGRTMLANAMMMRLAHGEGTDIIASPEVLDVLDMLLAGSEKIAAMGAESKMALCRAWMDGIYARTPSRSAAFLMARLLRSMLRQNPSIRRLAVGEGWIHTLDIPLRGMRLDNGMAWAKVKGKEPTGVMRHVWASVGDDDSRIMDGVYIRDSILGVKTR